MSAVSSPMPTLGVSTSAVRKITTLLAERGDPGLLLRVYIQGGGCSGFMYGFSLEEDRNEDDAVVENDGIKLVVDPLSYQYLAGAEVDYKEDLQGSRFVINNPNAATTCGCGSSFGV